MPKNSANEGEQRLTTLQQIKDFITVEIEEQKREKRAAAHLRASLADFLYRKSEPDEENKKN